MCLVDDEDDFYYTFLIKLIERFQSHTMFARSSLDQQQQQKTILGADVIQVVREIVVFHLPNIRFRDEIEIHCIPPLMKCCL